MKKLLHLIVLGLLLSSNSFLTQAAEIITRETFGNMTWDTGAQPPKTEGHAGHFKATEITTFTSTNGTIVGGSDNSIRINEYDTIFLATKPATWRSPSGRHHMHMGHRTGWNGSWDTTYFQGINIRNVIVTALEFGYIRARTFTNDALRWIDVHYRVDGGEWIQVDTTLYAPPVTSARETWFWIEAPIIIEEANTLDIRFAAMGRVDEQVYIDDITVMGVRLEPVDPPVGVPSVGSAFTLYPVPVESQLFISSNVAVERIEVFSIDGRVLVSKVLAGGNSVDLSGLRTGTYIARITKVNGEVVTRSILKK